MEMPRIPIDKIRENVVTLRTEYDPDSLEELGNSFGERGRKQWQPIIVQPGDGDWFDLVIGSRRFRAAKRKGLPDVGGYLIDKQTPVELLFIALAENLHRVDLNPFEEAQAFLRLMKEHGLDMNAVAVGVNKKPAYIRQRLQLLSMPEDVKTLVAERHLGVQHVPILARIPGGEDQTRLAVSAVHDRLTPSELRSIVARELDEPVRTEHVSREMTVVKLQARLGEFTAFLQKTHRRINLRRVNAVEKQAILASLQRLEDEVRALRASVAGIEANSSVSIPAHVVDKRRNHGQEWPTRDIRRINSPHRPSDEELGVELGRTPGAIRAMRAKTTEKS
ncbi:ParB/RepB/Spo0J family partition protein [Candidatus Kaiserbacteria bacterium]|nr:ParB/RepB/Spo0J family partition protein [Candidatus Kaiserbacteria bacterium]